MVEPVNCRGEAFRLFAEQIPRLETSTGLLRAAVAISMHAMESADVADVERRLAGLAQRVAGAARSGRTDALLAHLHNVLFEEEGLTGNVDDYYNPRNSYLPAVLESKLGIPISLCLVYKLVGELSGLKIEGISAPGHFLARVHTPQGPLLVDAFFGGRTLTPEEAAGRVAELTGEPVRPISRQMPAATHRQWIGRMLSNLQALFARQGPTTDFGAMNELATLLASG